MKYLAPLTPQSWGGLCTQLGFSHHKSIQNKSSFTTHFPQSRGTNTPPRIGGTGGLGVKQHISQSAPLTPQLWGELQPQRERRKPTPILELEEQAADHKCLAITTPPRIGGAGGLDTNCLLPHSAPLTPQSWGGLCTQPGFSHPKSIQNKSSFTTHFPQSRGTNTPPRIGGTGGHDANRLPPHSAPLTPQSWGGLCTQLGFSHHKSIQILTSFTTHFPQSRGTNTPPRIGGTGGPGSIHLIHQSNRVLSQSKGLEGRGP